MEQKKKEKQKQNFLNNQNLKKIKPKKNKALPHY